MNRRILLIDADPAFRQSLAADLAKFRFEITAEADPDEAMALGATEAPAVVIVAVDEPEKAGFKIFQRLKKGPLAKVPLVLVTSSVPPESFAKHRGLKVHADEYLDKRTLSKDELLGKLDNLIGLGEPAEEAPAEASGDSEDEDIPVEVDDIALADDDMVLDETVGEDDAGGGASVDSMVEAETDAAFDALLGGFDDMPVRPTPIPAAVQPVAEAQAPQVAPEAAPADEAESTQFGAPEQPMPGAISIDDLETAAEESTSGPSLDLPDDALEQYEPPASSGAIPVITEEPLPEPLPGVKKTVTSLDSSPAIMLDPDDLQVVEEESGGVPEPVHHPRSASDAEEAAAAREHSRPRFIEAATAIEVAPVEAPRAPLVDLGLDEVAERAESEQSGAYDRRALRKIGDLEHQLAQVKAELDRAKASADGASKGGSREREFLNLREQVITREKELGRVKADLAAREQEAAEAMARANTMAQGLTALEAKVGDLEQRLSAETATNATGAARERVLVSQLETANQQLEARAQAAATAEAARLQVERELAAERAARAATASEAERALRVEREQLVQKHQAELGALKHASDAALHALRKELEDKHEITVEALRQELASQATEAQEAAIAAARSEVSAEAEQAVNQLESQHATDIARLRDEHLEVTTRAAAEHATALSKLQTDHAAELRSVRDELDGRIVASAAAHDRTLTELTAELNRLKAELEAAHATHETARRDHEAALAARERELDAARQGDAASHAATLAAERTAHESALATARSEHEAALAALRGEHEAAIAAVRTEQTTARQDDAIAHTAQLAELRAEHEKQQAKYAADLAALRQDVEAARAQHAAELARTTAEAEAQVAALRAELAAQTEGAERALAELRESADRTLAETKAAAERAAADAKSAADRESVELRQMLVAAKRTHDEAMARHHSEREAAEQAHAAALADLKAVHERAMAVANGEVVKVKAVADAEHHRAVAAKDAELERVKTELASTHERERAALQAAHDKARGELATEKEELARGLSTARETIRRLETEVAGAVQTIADRNAELRAHADAVAERDQRITELRGEVTAIEQENASYQEQVLRAYQKIKADEAMVARAKKAMAIALTVLDDPTQPPKA